MLLPNTERVPWQTSRSSVFKFESHLSLVDPNFAAVMDNIEKNLGSPMTGGLLNDPDTNVNAMRIQVEA